ncbi:hypothetical protein [Actinokineospora globicatena]|uniref:Uncharacterized protein n=1 Tax=Actinokineospora globicatena TaxID=103729 RepID=A0A9W6QLX9_9PSEU|nr:hypothetical protein [Actinokineospora globicatena]GLW93346.1 hypothetical protein Aglo03_41620 [Actinokineospora globicatena]
MRENGDLATRLAAAGRDLCGPPSDAVVTAIMSRLGERRPRRSWRAPLAATAVVLAGTVAAAALTAGSTTSGLTRLTVSDVPSSETGPVQPDGCVSVQGGHFVPIAQAREVTGWKVPTGTIGTPIGIYRMYDDSTMLGAPYLVMGILLTVERYSPEVVISTANNRATTTPTTVGPHPALWYHASEPYELRYQGETPDRSFGGTIECKGSRLTWEAGGYTWAVSGAVDDQVLHALAEQFI